MASKKEKKDRCRTATKTHNMKNSRFYRFYVLKQEKWHLAYKQKENIVVEQQTNP